MTNNPWKVSDASAFLKYCCPECQYNHQELFEFSQHALESHVLATTLFDSPNNAEGDHVITNFKSDQIAIREGK